jgi:Type I restriction-modification system methyltransferase subunit
MANESATIVQKMWNYCNVLRDEGVSYGDYVEQLTYLLFLKMADEQTKPPFNKPSDIPKGLDWQSLLEKDGVALETHYHNLLKTLGKERGMLGIIFRKSQNRIPDPAKLKRLIMLINAETWVGLDIDVKGEIYEGLLQKNAEDTKSGAGQYFTPRPLIKAMVEVVKPEAGMTICDPACGTGGFLLSVHDYLSKNYQLDKEQKKFLRYHTFRGKDVAPAVVRLCAMNLYLHGIGGEESPIAEGDSLISDPGDRLDSTNQSTIWKKEQHHHYQWRRKGEQGILDLRKIRFLGNHVQQTTKLLTACKNVVEDKWEGSHSCAR